MALRGKSLFLYGYQITELNSSLDIRVSMGGPILMATLRLGFYSLTSLLDEIERACEEVDPDHRFTISADRAILGGLENRVSIETEGPYLDILFLSGPRAASSCAGILGFNVADYTGATSYTGSQTSGTVLIPEHVGYNYLSPDFNRKVFGAVNVAASGLKESVVFNIQKFWQVNFKYEPEDKVVDEWVPFWDWAIQQRLLEFTPDINNPTVFFEGTVERTTDDGKGLGYRMQEMLPSFPFFYETGLIQFRVRNT